MNYRSLKFSLKVWLTSVFIAPAIFLIADGYIESFNKNSFPPNYLPPEFYLIIAFFELIFSFVIWLLFWAIVELTIRFCLVKELQRWPIFIAGIVLTTLPIYFLTGFDSLINYRSEMFIPMAANMLCIGFGCWIYKL